MEQKYKENEYLYMKILLLLLPAQRIFRRN